MGGERAAHARGRMVIVLLVVVEAARLAVLVRHPVRVVLALSCRHTVAPFFRGRTHHWRRDQRIAKIGIATQRSRSLMS